MMIDEYGAGSIVSSGGETLASEIIRFAQDHDSWLTACAGATRADADHGFDNAASRFMALASGLVSESGRSLPRLQTTGDADRA